MNKGNYEFFLKDGSKEIINGNAFVGHASLFLKLVTSLNEFILLARKEF